MEEYKKQLVELIRATGKTLIENAEDYVGNGSLHTDIEISIRFALDGRIVDQPRIELRRTTLSKEALVMMGVLREDG